MNKVNGRALLLGIGLTLVSFGSASALTSGQLNDYILNVYSERYLSSERMEAYLKKNSIDIKDYKSYLKELEKYRNSKEYLWEKIENGSLLIDEILFTDKDIRAEYEKALKKLGSERLAYNFVKKNLVNAPKKTISKFETTMKDLNKVKKAFEDKFDRKANDIESFWLEDKNKMKRALYTGALGGRLHSQYEIMNVEAIIASIDEGYGHYALELDDATIKKYIEFTSKRDKYDEVIVSYAKIYSMFDSIYGEIMNKYGEDIYVALTDIERENIYNSCLDGFIFNEEKAYKKVINMMVSKGIIDDKNNGPSDSVKQDSDGVNPWAELEKYLKNKSSKSKKNSLKNLYSNAGLVSVADDLSEKFICYKYKDKDVNSYLRVSNNGKITSSVFEDLLDSLENEVNLKTVFSKTQMLSFMDGFIKTFDLVIEEEFEYKSIVEMLKQLGIELYLKDINFTEDVGIINPETSNDLLDDSNVETYSLIINLKDKMITYNLGDSMEIQVNDVKEILDNLDYKSVLSSNSILILKENLIKLSEQVNLKDDGVTMDKLKSLFEDIGEKVNIQLKRD